MILLGSANAIAFLSLKSKTAEATSFVKTLTHQSISVMKTPSLLAVLFVLGTHAVNAQLTYTVHCTREGLVGGTCANGHVIVANDHFCALPSKSVLSPNGTYTYTVNLRNPANGYTANNVPVWDVGPWNTNDCYWAANRPLCANLARGTPASQEAYYNNYDARPGIEAYGVNHDQKGRTVLNGSGIDLADGTFYDLGSPANVEVTYNWLTGTTVDNAAATFVGSWTAGTSSTDKYGADYRYHSTAAVSEPATFSASLTAGNKYNVYAWWPQGANRSTTAGYVVSRVGGTTAVAVNQQINGGKWNYLGNFNIAGGANTVQLSCWTTTGFIVVADAVNWR
jgi:hypothetical protein